MLKFKKVKEGVPLKYIMQCFTIVIITLFANIITISTTSKVLVSFVLFLLFVFINIYPNIVHRHKPTKRLRILSDGCELLIDFLISTGICIIILVYQWKMYSISLWLLHALFVFLVQCVVFWNGIIRVYMTSFQIGVRWRVIGVICGMIPIVNIIILQKIIRIAFYEATFESEKIQLNNDRKDEKICATKYPILLVHGVFFRDYKYFNYWGRIPKELEKNGAIIYYGNHESAASIKHSAEELRDRIEEIVKETGCEKVNIIAHSKGGLDSRYAIAHCGMNEKIASLTTINTPHRGCIFADYLLQKLPNVMIDKTAKTYNRALKKFGDKNPDFLSACQDLTASSAQKFNQEVNDSDDVYYQSIGSILNRASNGRFPLNFSTHLVKHFDGKNDGLVSEESFPWGEHYQFLTTKGKRGISHGDMIDLNRENIIDFDVREFYVQLVHELKESGY